MLPLPMEVSFVIRTLLPVEPSGFTSTTVASIFGAWRPVKTTVPPETPGPGTIGGLGGGTAGGGPPTEAENGEPDEIGAGGGVGLT